MAQRQPKPKPEMTQVSNVASEMLRSLGLEAVDPELVFELQKKEGAGSFGRVFRACYRRDPARLAALKVIPVALEAGQRGEDVESVRREIEFLRACDHPNVVAFYGAYYKDGALWVAMEYCGGGSVGDVSRARRLAEHEIAAIMRGALRGLAYLHSKKKIHRDIKGGNILLTAAGQVKIADFGVSAQLRDTMSRRGTFVGTPYWMSPEMIQDSDYDYKADIWSLGITAIELADQRPPLFDEHPMRVLIQIPRNPPPQLAVPVAWTPLFAQFLRFCLQKDPLERPTALECLDHPFVRAVDALERVFSDAGASAGGSNEAADEDRKGDAAGDGSGASGGELVASPSDLGRGGRESDEVAPSLPHELPTELESKGDDDGEDIAEDIARLDDDCESDAEANERSRTPRSKTVDGDRELDAASDSSSDGNSERRSRSSSDGGGGDGDGGEDGRSPSAREAFQFRQPLASHDAALCESVAMVSGDELLQLSVSESFELPLDAKSSAVYAAAAASLSATPTTSGAPPQHAAPEAPETAATEAKAAVKTATHSSASTELKLLPSKSTSPRTRKQPIDSRHAVHRFAAPASTALSRPSAADDARNTSRSRPASSAAAASGDTEQQRTPSSKQQQSVVTTTPKSLASVSSAWQNPLSDLETSASHPRVDVLLHSLNLSTSSASLSASSTRLFSELLRDEEQERAGAERDSVDSRYATPQSEASSLQPAPSAAMTSPLAAQARHARTSLTSSHYISSPFRVAHNVSVTFNSVDARFEGAPASEEWAALHRQFGLPLAQMRCGSDQRGVPALLHMLRRELLKRDGLATKHIYRLSPEKTEVQSVKAAINSGSVDHARVSDPHVYASLIKQWLRELPTLLLAALSPDDFGSVTSAAGFTGVEPVLAKLPPQERVVFEWLLEHMLEVVDKSPVNKMTAQSIAVVLAPNLFSCESLAKTPSGTSHAAGRVADFLCALLEWKQATRRRRRSSSVVLSSANRSLLLSVGSSSAGAGAGGSEPNTLPAPNDTAGSSRSELETARSAHDVATVHADKSSRGSATSDPSSSLQLRPLDDAGQPFDVAVALAVDGVWRELEARGIRSAEAIGSAKCELGECFERFQQSVLTLVARTSKRVEERDWADAALARLASSADAQTLAIPSSRYPMGDHVCVRDGRQQAVGADAIHVLFRQLSASSTRMTNASSRRENQGSHASVHGDASNDLLLLDGAAQLTQLIAAADSDERQCERTKAIAQCGEHEPAVGNLLAGLGNSALVAHLELDETQETLLATVESALRVWRLVQH